MKYKDLELDWPLEVLNIYVESFSFNALGNIFPNLSPWVCLFSCTGLGRKSLGNKEAQEL